MLEETRALLAAGVPAQRLIELGLEYRYLTRHLMGELSYDEMVTQLENAIVQFAKRQMTWFGRDPRIEWLDPGRALEQAQARVATMGALSQTQPSGQGEIPDRR